MLEGNVNRNICFSHMSSPLLAKIRYSAYSTDSFSMSRHLRLMKSDRCVFVTNTRQGLSSRDRFPSSLTSRLFEIENIKRAYRAGKSFQLYFTQGFRLHKTFYFAQSFLSGKNLSTIRF